MFEFSWLHAAVFRPNQPISRDVSGLRLEKTSDDTFQEVLVEPPGLQFHHCCGPWHQTKTYYQNNKYCINLACDPSWDDDIPFPYGKYGKSLKIPWFQPPPTSYWLTYWISDDLDFCTTGWMVNGGKTMNKITNDWCWNHHASKPCSWFNHHMFFHGKSNLDLHDSMFDAFIDH